MTENIIQEEKIQNSYKKEFLFFKNDLLKDLKIIESKINSKLKDSNNNLDAKLNDYEIKLSLFLEKINHLSQLISQDKHLEEKIIKLEKYKEKINESLLNNEIKIDSIKYDLKNAINKYDNLFLENIFCPGLIGVSYKYKNFRELIDYILSQISNLNSSKDKTNNDLKNYKIKLENSIQNVKYEFSGINRNLMELTNKQFFDYEEKLKNSFNKLENKIKEIQNENIQNLFELKNKIENNNLNKQFIIPEIKEGNDFYYNLLNQFNNIQNDFNLIKYKFTQLSEYIKDEKCDDNKKSNIINLSKKIDFSQKKVIELPYEKNKNKVKGLQNNINSFILRKMPNEPILNISDFDKNNNKIKNSLKNLKKSIKDNNIDNNEIENNSMNNNTKCINFNNHLNIEDNNIIDNENENNLIIKNKFKMKNNNSEFKDFEPSKTNNDKITKKHIISKSLFNEENVNMSNINNNTINKILKIYDKLSPTNNGLKFNLAKTYTSFFQNDKNKNLRDSIILSNENSISLKNIFNNSIGINKENLDKNELKIPNSLREKNIMKISNNEKINLRKDTIKSFSHDNIFKTNLSNKDSNSNLNEKEFKEIKLNFINKKDNKIACIKKKRIEKYLKEIKPKMPNYNEFYQKFSENNT